MSDEPKILVVDDNEDFCRNVTDILQTRGYEVVTAYDGFAAIELIKQDGFNVVLLDIKMPGLDGAETFRIIQDIAPDTPVIMVTAYAVTEIIKEVLREGAFGFLEKPLDFDRLFGLIAQAVPNGVPILVVDDDQNLCANIKDVLAEKGYRVSVADNGDRAIEKSWEEKFDIMLIDMKLPPKNGLATYLSIRDIRPSLVVIIITGFLKEMSSLIEQTLQESAYTCLTKPIDFDELVSLLERIKQQKQEGTL